MNIREAINMFRGHRTPHFRIIPRKKWWFLLSGFFIALSIVGLAVRQLNFSIDFEGGAQLQYPNPAGVTADQVGDMLSKFGRGDAEVQVVAGKEGSSITVRTRSLTSLGREPATKFTFPNKAGVSEDQIRLVFAEFGRDRIRVKTTAEGFEATTRPVPQEGLGPGLVLTYPNRSGVSEQDVLATLSDSGRPLADVASFAGTVTVKLRSLEPSAAPSPSPSGTASPRPTTSPSATATPGATPSPTPTGLTPKSTKKELLAALAQQAGVKPSDIDVRDLANLGRDDLVGAVASVAGATPDEVAVKDMGGRQREELLSALATQAGVTTADINIRDFSPTWGSQISKKALQGLIIFLVLVTIYIGFRFEWKMALAAQGALLHDLIITAGVYALVGREVTPATVIAILTILGYSLYDTVVIFDRVKENTESLAAVARDTYGGVVNLSLNETLMRSVNTSLVVVLPILSLLLFGGETLKDFAFALFVGVTSGAYSSIFIASPILSVLKEREPRYQQIRARALQRAARPGLRAVPAGAAAAESGDGEAAATPAPRPARQPAQAGARPSKSGARSGSSRTKKKKKTPAAKRRRR